MLPGKPYKERHCGMCEIELHVGFKLKDHFGTYRQKKDIYDIHPLVVQILFRIDGVISVALGDDFFFIKKAEVYSWDDILPSVYRVIECYGNDELDDSMTFPDKSSNYRMYTKKIYYHNTDMMTIHVGIRMSDELTYRSEFNNELPIVKDLRLIKGVDEVYLDQYSVSITRTWNTKWRSITDQIDKVIARHIDLLMAGIA